MVITKRIYLIILFLMKIIDTSYAITRHGNVRPYSTDWRSSYIRPEDEIRHYRSNPRDGRSANQYPTPQVPWEEALRHSVYLTLIRDKIDQLIANNGAYGPRHIYSKGEIEKNEQEDINLWHEIRKATFKINNKERGPIFGDIAILSRGKLIETHDGLEFIEDDNIKECIECHLYSARMNELEAEKTLGKVCKGPNCDDQNVKAVWIVRRIRHRNYESDENPFKYELMFSIASVKSSEKTNYNSQTQTFSLSESDKPAVVQEIQNGQKYNHFIATTTPNTPIKSNYYNNQQYVTFENQKPFVFKDNHDISKNRYDESESHTEHTLWVHKNINHRQNVKPTQNIYFPDAYQPNKDQTLNTGEAYFAQNKQNFRPDHYDEDRTQSVNKQLAKSRGNKKYENDEKIIAETEYDQYENKNLKIPVITHLHHHYYLDDKGMPIVKYPENFVNNQEATDVSKSPTVASYSEITTSDTNDFNQHSQSVQGTTKSNRVRATTIPVVMDLEPRQLKNNTSTKQTIQSIKPTTLQMSYHGNRIHRVRPTKPFKPSPKEVKIRYSEIDPLYTTTNTPVSHVTEPQVLTTYLESTQEQSVSDTTQILPTRQTINSRTTKYTTKSTTETATESSESKVFTVISESETENLPKNVEDTHTESTTEKIQIVLPENNYGNKKSVNRYISYPTYTTPTASTEEKFTAKVVERKKFERPTRKPSRRVKLQKNFNELINAQLPPPDKSIGTTIPYTVSTVTQSSSENSSIVEDASEKTIGTGYNANVNERQTIIRSRSFVPRNPRTKYQRKSNTWSSRRLRPRPNYLNRDNDTKEITTISKIIEDQQSNITTTLQTDSIIQIEEITTTISTTVFEDNTEKLPYNNNTELNESSVESTNIQNVYEIANETTISTESNTFTLFHNDENNNTTPMSTTSDHFDVDTTFITSTGYHSQNNSGESYDELFTPLTKKSLVTSISLKLGNKTRPYISSTATPLENANKNEFDESELMETILKEFDLKNAQKAMISEISTNNTQFTIYKAEEAPKDMETWIQNKTMDDITRHIINHAKLSNLATMNITTQIA